MGLRKLENVSVYFSLLKQLFSDGGTLWLAFFIYSLGQYLNLDKDHNGMLSKEELSRYGTGTLTNIFLDRVFQECLTYDGEMVITYFHFVHCIKAFAYSVEKCLIISTFKTKSSLRYSNFCLSLCTQTIMQHIRKLIFLRAR